MVMQEIDDVIGRYLGNSRKVLEYSQLIKRLVDQAKQPGFSIDSWAPLADLVATEKFKRVGNFKEVMNWNEYLEFLTSWAKSSDWDCSFKRISAVDNVVFLELEERSKIGEFISIVNSVSVYEFNRLGKIEHVDIYLQMEMPNPDMLKSYEGVVY